MTSCCCDVVFMSSFLTVYDVAGLIIELLSIYSVSYLYCFFFCTQQSVWPWAQETKFFDSFPLFPMCMLGGIMLQLLLVRTNKAHIVNVKLMSRLVLD